jgi:hypothetical protein
LFEILLRFVTNTFSHRYIGVSMLVPRGTSHSVLALPPLQNLSFRRRRCAAWLRELEVRKPSGLVIVRRQDGVRVSDSSRPPSGGNPLSELFQEVKC